MQVVGCRVNIISRGNGRSAVGASAYRMGIALTNEYDGKPYDYTHKKGVIYTEILLPDYAPEWMLDRNRLWNSVEKIEKQCNSQLAREVQIDLPRELTYQQNIEPTKEYAQGFVNEGMIADIAIHAPHKGNPNPHAHIMLTMRPLTPEGKWEAKCKKEYVLDENGDRIKLKSGQWKSNRKDTTDWDKLENVEKWRERYALTINKYMEMYGHDKELTHISYER